MKKSKLEESLSFKNIFQRQTKLAAYIIACMTVLVLGISYALFLRVDSNSSNQVVTAGDLSFTYKDGSTISSSSNMDCFMPMSDDEANMYNSSCSYQFSVQNSGTLKANYTFKLVDNGSKVASSKLKYVLKKQNTSGILEVVKNGLVSELSSGLLVQEDIAPKKQVVYSIQVYVVDGSVIDSDLENAVNYTIDGTGLVNEDAVDPEKPKPTAAEYITTLAATDTTNLAADDYNNIRYIGANPSNYINIDGDIWRIMGLMKDVDDGTGNKEDRVKIIRASSIGSYSWDTSASGDSSLNSGMGVNEWSQADLMKLLNSGYESESVGGSLYWNKKSGTCYTGHGDTTSSCSFTSSGINDKLKLLIGDAVWNTGATNSSYLAAKLYQSERENDTGKKCTVGSTWCTDTVTRTATWNGKLAIMYPSDYGYATSGGSTTDRATCLNTSLDTWGNYSECYNNDWLYDGNTQWFLNPVALASYAVFGNYLIYGSVIYNNSGDTAVFKNYDIKPTTYLLSNVSIKSGDGTSSNPFILE